MVNKCSVVGCKSLYVKKYAKLHRFPLTNTNILPLWIAITGKESDWKPNKSSRLCCNHFIASDYISEHKKGVLKPTAIPSIEYRVNVPVKLLKYYFYEWYSLEYDTAEKIEEPKRPKPSTSKNIN
ncbi:THAP domain-containing protein 1-like [Rhopalosiphum maidis]|uniref:THAP domain-containing protein 1-like n=1 Tax=Rhopalosiphum maidis TaxID=43146 RepID=UPI000F003280|nr:THAP domain-containing protein 1-like [Rhopalosiphum maidis]